MCYFLEDSDDFTIPNVMGLINSIILVLSILDFLPTELRIVKLKVNGAV